MMNRGFRLPVLGRGGGKAAGVNLNAYADKLVTLFGANIISYLPLWESAGAYADDYGSNNIDGQYSASGVTLGEAGIGDGRTCIKVSAGGFVNWYSAAFVSAFNGKEGTLLTWAKVSAASAWSDGLIHDVFKITANANNYVRVFKSSAAGRLEYLYWANGAQRQFRLENNSSTAWMQIGITWSYSNNRVRCYFNGSQVDGGLTIPGEWTIGTLSETSTLLAAESTVLRSWDGWMGHALVLNREATPAEVANSAVLPFDLSALEAEPFGSSLRTFTLASGGDIDAACAQMRAGDTLELAAGGSYVIPAGTGGFSSVPSGAANYPTKVNGNGATISGGDYAISPGPKAYIDFHDLTAGPAKYWALFCTNCNHLTFTDCDFYNPASGVAYDVCRFDNDSYFTFTRCNAHSTTDIDEARAHDGFEMWGPCDHFAFTDCKAYNIKNGATQNEGHGFEVYGQLAGQIVSYVTFTNCEAYNTQVGFSVEGGPLGLAHTNIVCDGCSSHDNAFYGYQGVDGATLTRTNVAGHDNTNNGASETNGSVVDV